MGSNPTNSFGTMEPFLIPLKSQPQFHGAYFIIMSLNCESVRKKIKFMR